MNWKSLKHAIQDFDLREFIIDNILRVKFIINEHREFGVRVFGINCYYYKRSSPLLYIDNKNDDGSRLKWREVTHREFGESLMSPYEFESCGKHTDWGWEYKMNEQWTLVARYPVPKFVVDEIRKKR